MRRLLLLASLLAPVRPSPSAPPPPLPAPATGSAPAAVASLARLLSRGDAASLLDIRLDAGAGACSEVAGGGRGGALVVTAPSAVEAVAAVAAFLASAANFSVAWPRAGGVQSAGVPRTGPLPAPAAGAPFRRCRLAALPYSYAQNVVQSSYSNVWWQADRWQAELDWMAAKGVNLALAYGGQEALFRDVYAALGVNDGELGAFFNGPAFLAWSRGQGQAGVGGPLPGWWHAQQLALNQGVVAGMNALGITPVLPSFQGNVPLALRALYPAANISALGWLDVFDPLFGTIADMYMTRLLAAYPNATHFYEADGLFSSGTPPWAAAAPTAPPAHAASLAAPNPDAQARSRAAFATMTRHDADAIWVYQSWIWRGMSSSSDLEYVQGWLSGPPPGRMLLLDQTAERVPIWQKWDNFSFGGQHFAWLSMNNMGGNLGLVGSLAAVGGGVAAALQSGGGALTAVGMDPEGIDVTPAYWEYVLSLAYAGAAAVDPAAFLADWGVRRCGREDARVRRAWQLLAATAFRANQTNFEHHLAYCPTAMPLASIGNSWNRPMIRAGFEAAPLAEAWSLLIDAAPACAPAALYDIADVGREFLSLFPCVAAHDALSNATDAAALAAARAAMAAVLADLDELLASNAGFLAGAWIADARALGAAANAPPGDLDLLEWNARSQVSTWFPSPPSPSNGLCDYGNKVWAGMVSAYYAQRYDLFADAKAAAILAGHPDDVNATAYAAALTDLGSTFTRGKAPLPARPAGDTAAIARRLWDKYAKSALA